MRKLYLLAGISLFTVSKAQTDTIKKDTIIPAKSLISYTPTTLESKPKFFQKEWVKKSIAPSILFVASAATWDRRNKYVKTETGIFQILRFLTTIICNIHQHWQYMD